MDVNKTCQSSSNCKLTSPFSRSSTDEFCVADNALHCIHIVNELMRHVFNERVSRRLIASSACGASSRPSTPRTWRGSGSSPTIA